MKKNLNDYLKKIKTYSELQLFLKIIEYYGFSLHGRRRGYWAFNFYNEGADRVHYMYDDGVSRGKSFVKDLWKVLEIR